MLRRWTDICCLFDLNYSTDMSLYLFILFSLFIGKCWNRDHSLIILLSEPHIWSPLITTAVSVDRNNIHDRKEHLVY